MTKIRDLAVSRLPGARDNAIPWLACEGCFDDSAVSCPDPSKSDDGDGDDDKDKHKDDGKKRDDHKTKYIFNDAAVAQLKQQLRTELDRHA